MHLQLRFASVQWGQFKIDFLKLLQGFPYRQVKELLNTNLVTILFALQCLHGYVSAWALQEPLFEFVNQKGEINKSGEWCLVTVPFMNPGHCWKHIKLLVDKYFSGVKNREACDISITTVHI